MEEELRCPICFENFDFDIHRPMLLPACGHTFCRACLLSNSFDTCPEDRSKFTDPGTLPTNILALRGIESRVKRIPGVDDEVKLIRSDDLRLEARIGQGGSGEVWRGFYRGKMVAVKVFSSLDLREPNSSTPSTTTAAATSSSSGGGGRAGAVMSLADQPLMRVFVKEVQLLQVVSEDSMYCCRLLGCAVKDNKPCIVMKWYGNGHLQVPQGGYDLAAALQWGSAIAKALADVHALGIVVADLKPENVLISDQGDPVLADFGISRQVAHTMAALTQGRSSSVTAQGIQGTPYYMAPEQWQAARLTNRTDIWSWGCLMLQLLTGIPPWLHLNLCQVMGMVVVQKATPKVPSSLPGWLAALLQSCFAYEPSGRPSAAELVAVIKANTTLLPAPGTQARAGGTCVTGGVMPSHSTHVPDTAMPPAARRIAGSSSSTESTQQLVQRLLQLFSPTLPVQSPGADHAAAVMQQGVEQQHPSDFVTVTVHPPQAAAAADKPRAQCLVSAADSKTAPTAPQPTAAAATAGKAAGSTGRGTCCKGCVPSKRAAGSWTSRRARVWILAVLAVCALAIGVGVGAGLGVKQAAARRAGSPQSLQPAEVPQDDTIARLVAQLSSSSTTEQETAAGALWRIAYGDFDNTTAIVAVGAVPKLVRLLGSTSTGVQEHAAGALGTIAYGVSDNKKAIATAGAVPKLVQLLGSTSEGVQEMAAAALKNIADDGPDISKAIVAAGAVPKLVQLLRSTRTATQEYSAWALRDIAAGGTGNRKAIVNAGAVPALQHLAQSNDQDVRSAAEGALRALNSNNAAATVQQYGNATAP